MPMEKLKPVAASLLIVNFGVCILIFGIGGWVMNGAIDKGFVIGGGFELPPHFSPIFFPIGNSATGFFVIFALIAAVAVVASAISGNFYLRSWTYGDLPAAASTALIACFLTLLAMGFAWKEIALTTTSGHLIALEAFLIILSITQFIYTATIMWDSLKSDSERRV